MVNLSITIEGEVFKRSIAQCWGDVTLKAFLKLRKMDGTMYTFSERVLLYADALAEIPRETILQCTDINICDKLYPFFHWLEATDDKGELLNPFDAHKYLVPDFVEVNGVQLQKPKGIGLGTWGQKLVLEQILTNNANEGLDEIDTFAPALALYLQPEYDQLESGSKKASFDAESAKKLEGYILDMPLSQVWPLASFFLSNYGKLLAEKTSSYNINLTRIKYLQELTALKGSAYGRQLSPFRKLLAWVLIKFWSLVIPRSSLHSHLTPKKPGMSGSYTIQ